MDHLVIATRILWPNGGRINGVPLYTQKIANTFDHIQDHSRLGLENKFWENKSGRIFLRLTGLLYRFLPANLGILYFVDWTGLDWTSKTRTSKTRTGKTRASKTRTGKTRTCKTPKKMLAFTSPRFLSPRFTSPVQSSPAHGIQYAANLVVCKPTFYTFYTTDLR